MPTSFVEGFETYIRTELGLSQETISAYVRDVEEFFDFIGTQKITAQLIEIFIGQLKQNGLKSTTIRRKCMSIRCLCHHLISLGHLDPHIIGMIDSVRISRRMSNALDSKAVDDLISTMEKSVPALRAINVRRNVAIILTLYHSGLRVSELCGLNLLDINFDRKEMKVRGKGGRDRVVPTTKECIQAIKEYLYSDRESITDAVFVKSNGQRLTRRAVSDMLMSLSRRAGVEHTTSHMLRRSCATSLMNRGMDLDLVQSLLGHKHLSTTQTYLAISYKRLAEIHKSCHPFGEKYAIK